MSRCERKRKPSEKVIEMDKSKQRKDDSKRKDEGAQRPCRISSVYLPQGSINQQKSSMKLFDEYLLASNFTWLDIQRISKGTQEATKNATKIPNQSTYSVLQGFVRFLYNYDAPKTRNKEISTPFQPQIAIFLKLSPF